MFGATVGSLKMFLQTSDPLEKTLVKKNMHKISHFLNLFYPVNAKKYGRGLKKAT